MRIHKVLSYLLLISLFGCCTLSSSIPNPELKFQPIPIISKNELPNNLVVNLYIDPRFTPFEQQEIENAMKEWYIQAYPIIQYTIVTSPTDTMPNLLFVIRSHSKDALFSDVGVEDLLGFYSASFTFPIVVLIVDNIAKSYEPNMFYETVLHEFGHAWGLEHQEQDYNSLMYPYAHVALHNLILKAGSTHITPTDMAQFCSLYRCL